MLVEHDQESWTNEFLMRYQELKRLEKQNPNKQSQQVYSESLKPIVEFFKKLENQAPSLMNKSSSVDRAVQTMRKIQEPLNVERAADQEKDKQIE